MFQSARIHLTLWYMLLITGLTSSVSLFVYWGLNGELRHLELLQETIQSKNPTFFHTFETGQRVTVPLPVPQAGRAIGFKVVQTDVSAIRWRIISTLVLVNAGIALVIGAISYFLAGKTLRPIKEMVEEQHRFLADAAHELRTPLTSLRTATEVALRDRGLSLAEAKILLKENLQEFKNLQYLSESLLRLSAPEDRAASEGGQIVRVDEIVNEAVKKVKAAARAKKIAIRVVPSPLAIKGDFLAVVEVLVILLDNAIKYSPKQTEIKIESQRRRDQVVIKVIDQGVGIEAQVKPHIFDRFYRADQSRAAQVGSGYGLGLAIAQRIIEQQRGRIEVESQVGKGSTFGVWLPAGQIS